MEPKQKELLEFAAELDGNQPVTGLAMSASIERAQAIIANHQRTLVTLAAFKSLEKLLKENKPSLPALRDSMKCLREANDELKKTPEAGRKKK